MHYPTNSKLKPLSSTKSTGIPARLPCSDLGIRNQHGVALLTVLLLVVAITVVAGSMLASQKMTVRKSTLVFDQSDLNQQLTSGKLMAIELIEADSKLNNYDSQQDIWAQQIPPYITDKGIQVSIQVSDAAAKFNINNLYHDGQVDEEALQTFERLLTSLNIDLSFAKVVLDWQDPDTTVYNDTAEEAVVYLSQEGKTPANQPFISVDQLVDLPDIDADMVATLRPHITAVPYWLPVNANTASETVLSAILANADNEVQSIVQAQVSGVTSKEALNQLAQFSQIDEKKREQAKQQLDIQSKAFDVLVTATQGLDKSKYSTLVIAKSSHANEPNNTNLQSNIPSASNNGIAKGNKTNEIQAFNQRYWVFKPYFPEVNSSIN